MLFVLQISNPVYDENADGLELHNKGDEAVGANNNLSTSTKNTVGDVGDITIQIEPSIDSKPESTNGIHNGATLENGISESAGSKGTEVSLLN